MNVPAREREPVWLRFQRPLLLALTLCCFAAVHFSQRHLNLLRDTMGLTRLTPLKNAPPMLAFTTVALGGFRGLIANVLWIRASEMQESEKYFEMVQLSDWITKLQPSIPVVWQHLAWNMSYNISVKFPDPRDRWLWVQRGIRLLRDEGLQYNPRATSLYYELAWHFQHKMGHYLDDAHNFYKARWAEEMTEVLGSGRPDFAELMAPQSTNAQARATKLREVYKMDPAFMKKVDDIYDPLEWRLPEAHAVYWAMQALEQGEDVSDTDRRQVRRAVHQSMQLAFIRGRLVYPTAGNPRYEYRPNLQIVAQANKAYEDMIAAETDGAYLYGDGHKNFLRQAVYLLWTEGRTNGAAQWRDYLGTKFPDAVPPDQTLADFALAQVYDIANDSSPTKVTAVLESLFLRYFQDLAIGLDSSAENYKNQASKLWFDYLKRYGGNTNAPAVGIVAQSEQRIGLDFYNIYQSLRDEVLDPQKGYFSLEDILRLRTALNLPAPSAETNQPPGPALSPSPTNAPAGTGTTNRAPPPSPSGG